MISLSLAGSLFSLLPGPTKRKLHGQDSKSLLERLNDNSFGVLTIPFRILGGQNLRRIPPASRRIQAFLRPDTMETVARIMIKQDTREVSGT